jgi:hypothetical protein
MLIVVGECASCSSKSINYQHLDAMTDEQIVLIFQSRMADISVNDIPKRFIILEDSKFALFDKLHAVWQPRWYRIDGRGKLIGIQSDPQEMPLTHATNKVNVE